jgi:hypothetical protein
MSVTTTLSPFSNLAELTFIVESQVTHIQNLKHGEEKSSVVIGHIDVAVNEFVRKLFNNKYCPDLGVSVSGLWSYHHDNFITDSIFDKAEYIDAKTISFERVVKRFLDDLNKTRLSMAAFNYQAQQ